MIRVSVMYPSRLGARFDHECYRDEHMTDVAPIVQISEVVMQNSNQETRS